VVPIIEFVLGIAVLVYSAEKLIGYLVGVASRWAISLFLVAVVFTGIEFDDLAYGIVLNLDGLKHVALGTVVGTSIAMTGIVLALAALVAAYALAYVIVGERMFAPNLADSFRARPWGIYPHAFFGALAMAIGPFQFRRRLLRHRRSLHRALGKVYVVACVLGGSAGLYMAAYSYGGWTTHLGFGALAVLLLTSTLRAYAAVRRGEIVRHREWMVRSYSLIFAAVTLRLELPLLTAALGGFEPAYAVVSWLCWVPNLLWAEWYLRRTSLRETQVVRQLQAV
jgi:uncharacterized membrane protein